MIPFDRFFFARLALYALGFFVLFLDVVIGASILALTASLPDYPKDPQ